jgi:16S rRNA (guanine(966)-N(2))-methyltransferase RsmD
MRVISGSAKGITLAGVPGKSTRPITDRVKEALFNILGPSVYDTRWLDLFGGTGAVGIEALSRGADSVVFTEINYRAYKIILQNLEAAKLAEYAEVIKMDAFTYLNGEIEEDFDIVYVAPPQYKGIWIKAMQALDENPDWVHPKGSVIVQIHPKEYDTSIGYTNFKEFDQRNYGDTRLVFYHRISAE